MPKSGKGAVTFPGTSSPVATFLSRQYEKHPIKIRERMKGIEWFKVWADELDAKRERKKESSAPPVSCKKSSLAPPTFKPGEFKKRALLRIRSLVARLPIPPSTPSPTPSPPTPLPESPIPCKKKSVPACKPGEFKKRALLRIRSLVARLPIPPSPPSSPTITLPSTPTGPTGSASTLEAAPRPRKRRQRTPVEVQLAKNRAKIAELRRRCLEIEEGGPAPDATVAYGEAHSHEHRKVKDVNNHRFTKILRDEGVAGKSVLVIDDDLHPPLGTTRAVLAAIPETPRVVCLNYDAAKCENMRRLCGDSEVVSVVCADALKYVTRSRSRSRTRRII